MDMEPNFLVFLFEFVGNVKREGKWKFRWVEGVVPLVVVREEDDEGGRGMKRKSSIEER
ncbi:hypothetical protein TSUD_27170 [Trifolium subterraneum]|uniref:Uncharacterized protein n=1 Tax=Trifolium subterraneum TaxID=3900 RepID=A0A2Z6LZQ7_TRISU|nr:hypothetical protein TSUD_27170 [Trifolium subterraneum]